MVDAGRVALLFVLLAACGDDAPVVPPPDPICGDGTVNPELAEECDDANTDAEDGCHECKVIPIPTQPWDTTVVIDGLTDPRRVAMRPKDVAIDTRGNLYVADTYRDRVFKVDVAGSIEVVAGNGTEAYAGDGFPARNAALRNPNSVAVDAAGNVYIADMGNNVIRKVGLDGIIRTIAGTGVDGFSGEGLPATSAKLSIPAGVAVGTDGTVYIADSNNHRIRAINAAGEINTIAGTGADGFGGDEGPATSAMLNSPLGVAVTETGVVLIADSYNARIRSVFNGEITTVAGDGTLGTSGDNGPAIGAQLTTPTDLTLHDGIMYIADADTDRIRRVDGNTGVITTIAGGESGFGGDGGPATAARLSLPQGIAADATGVYIADTANFRIRKIDPAATISTVAGSGEFDDVGDFGRASAATLLYPRGLHADAGGNLYVADSDHHRVRKIAPDGTITTVAGTGMVGAGGDGGPAIAAQVTGPVSVTTDAAGRVYVGTINALRKIEVDGTISTLASGLAFVSGVAVAATGDILFSERDTNLVKRIPAAGGTPIVVAGIGTPGFSGDAGDPTLAELRSPDGVFVSGANYYIADTGNRRVRFVDTTLNTITTVAGNGTIILDPLAMTGDGGPATSAPLYPLGVVEAGGDLYIADGLNYRVRKVSGGIITSLAGTSVEGNRGDGDLGASARIGTAMDIAVAGGDAFVLDQSNFRIRRISGTTGVITTFGGRVEPAGAGPLERATLADPRAIALTPDALFIAGGTSGTLQAIRGTSLDVVAGRYQQDVATGDLARYRDPTFGAITGVAYDSETKLVYVTEFEKHRIHAITMVDPTNPDTWTIAAIANTAGTEGMADGAIATATFRNPSGLHLDQATKTLFVVDTGNNTIRAIDLTLGMVSTIAGTPGQPGFGGDGGPATAAQLDSPRAITRCANGDLFVADTNNHRVRRIAGGTISTVLGDGQNLATGEGIPATSIPAAAPRGLACDANNDVYVTTTQTVRRLIAAGSIVDGTGEVETIFGRRRDTFPASTSDCLTGIDLAAGPLLRIVDACAGTLVELRPPPTRSSFAR